jgi:hypothetical protein
MAVLAVVRRVLAWLVLVDLMGRAIHGANGQERPTRRIRIGHPPRRQQGAKQHRGQGEMNGNAAKISRHVVSINSGKPIESSAPDVTRA